MFRTYQSLFNRLLQIVDALVVVVSFLYAWYLKFDSGLFAHTGGHLSFRTYMGTMLFAIPAYLFANWISGLYRPMRIRSLLAETIPLIRSAVIGTLVYMSAIYFSKLVGFSRELVAIFAIAFVVLSTVERVILRAILRSFRAKGFNQKFILIIGGNPAVNRLVHNLEHHPWFGYRILGYLRASDAAGSLAAIPCLGDVSSIRDILQQQLVDHVIIALPEGFTAQLGDYILACEAAGVQALILPDYSEVLPANPRFDNFAGLPIIDTRYVPLDDAVNATLKRTFDIAFSLLVLILLSPIYVIIAGSVKLTSRGPILFVQQRVGRNRRTFFMYKFRTMYNDGQALKDESDDTGWSTSNDPRRTRIGRFLRRTSLDELPQFWNVLIGDMSVIGPRPERSYFVEQFREDIPKYMVKHRVRPGITGWAQVHGWRGDTSITERIRYDIEYIENWSMTMDLKICLRTIRNGFINRNAY